MANRLSRFISNLGIASILACSIAPANAEGPRLADVYRALPLTFEPIQDAAATSDRFTSQARRFTLSISSTDAVMSLRSDHRRSSVAMRLVGANRDANVAGVDRQRGTVNYFVGDDPRKWRTGVPTYAKAEVRQVYPGIDLLYYGNQQRLEYDFIVEPGADPGRIRLELDGVDRSDLDAQGDLVLQTQSGTLRLGLPIIYQDIGGRRQAIRGRYVRHGRNQVAFDLGRYDPAHVLVIDPQLTFASNFGGDDFDDARAVAVDAAGFVYMAGNTNSGGLSTPGAFQENRGLEANAFVAKFDVGPAPSIVYVTYLGGTRADWANALAVTESGIAYVTGPTASFDFPTTANAFEACPGFGLGQPPPCPPPPPGTANADAFLAVLDSSGSQLLYGSYVGTDQSDDARAIATDDGGNAYISGETRYSEAFFAAFSPAVRLSPGLRPNQIYGYVAKIDVNGSGSLASWTFLNSDRANGVAVDRRSGTVYVTGTAGSDFRATPGALRVQPYDGWDSFVTALMPGGGVASTFLGGTSIDEACGVAVDGAGNVYVAGSTSSADFPVVNGTSPAAAHRGFLVKLDPTLSSVAFSTLLEGSGDGPNASIHAIALDGAGRAHLAGLTTAAAASVCHQDSFGVKDALFAIVDASKSGSASLVYRSTVGGSSEEIARAVAVAPGLNDSYIAGSTSSGNFPTVAGLPGQVPRGSRGDAFVARFGNPRHLVSWGFLATGTGDPVEYLTPIPVSGMDDVLTVAAGLQHALGLKADGTLWGWGFNGAGEIGSSNDPVLGTFARAPRRVVDPADPTGFLTGVVAMAAGAQTSFALKANGTVWAWGNDSENQLGDDCGGPCPLSRPTPLRVPGVSNAIAISTGILNNTFVAADTLAVIRGGTVWQWGRSGAPAPVDGLTEVRTVAAGAINLALKHDGTVWAWRRGIPDFPPTPIPGLTSVIAIASRAHPFSSAEPPVEYLALKSDRTVWRWDGVSESATPVSDPLDPTGTLTNVRSIGGGIGLSAAVKMDGSIWTWGFGFAGDGIGPSERLNVGALNHPNPVRAKHVDGSVSVAPTANFTLALATEPPPNLATVSDVITGDGGQVATVMWPPADTVAAVVDVPDLADPNDSVQIGINELPADDPSLPPPPPNSLSHVFRFAPEGKNFDLRDPGPIRITLKYDDAEVAGKDESQLQVNLLLAAGYTTLPDCTDAQLPDPNPCVYARYPDENRVVVLSTHFSVYGQHTGAPLPPLPPPNVAPRCDAAVAAPASLWPPNHKVVPIAITGVTDADGDGVTFTVTSILQDEPPNGDDKKHAIDGFGLGTSQASVRAERCGIGNGRVYHVLFRAADPSGASCSGHVTVGVPHDRRHPTAVDGGALYDSTKATARVHCNEEDDEIDDDSKDDKNHKGGNNKKGA